MPAVRGTAVELPSRPFNSRNVCYLPSVKNIFLHDLDCPSVRVVLSGCSLVHNVFNVNPPSPPVLGLFLCIYVAARTSGALTLALRFKYGCDEFGPPGCTLILPDSSLCFVDQRNVWHEQPSFQLSFTLFSYSASLFIVCLCMSTLK